MVKAFFKCLILRVVFSHLVGKGGPDDIAQDIIESDFVVIIVLSTSKTGFIVLLALSQATNLLVSRFNEYLLWL